MCAVLMVNSYHTQKNNNNKIHGINCYKHKLCISTLAIDESGKLHFSCESNGKTEWFFLSRARLETVKLPLSVHLFEISSYNRILKLCTGPFMTVSSMGNIN